MSAELISWLLAGRQPRYRQTPRDDDAARRRLELAWSAFTAADRRIYNYLRAGVIQKPEGE